MKSLPISIAAARTKASTGIAGLDEITGGGLPRGRTTLLAGGPGSGKTIFALQFLAHGARDCREPGIFVAFEEASDRILVNCESFGWKLADMREKEIFFLDAQPVCDMVQSGTFDLSGMLAVLAAKAEKMGARRVVFDALDVLLALLPDRAAKRREVHRLHQWLLEHKLTGIVTAKAGGDDADALGEPPFGFMQFMVDCAVILTHQVEMGVSQRQLRVQKYRGSSFDENESPFRIEKNGITVAVARTVSRSDVKVSNQRVSSGVEQLDAMLGGGYYRATCILITGQAGTAKTTLSAQFADAACRRGEQTVFMSFDSDGTEVIRNMASVGIRLDRHVKSGKLRIVSARTFVGSGGAHLVRIKEIVRETNARCVVIDPVSTLCKSSSELPSHTVAELLIDWAKIGGINLICTDLQAAKSRAAGESSSSLHISTLADTWIQLSYVMQAGANNRGLRIIKSRGTAHSNRMRELFLSDKGVSLGSNYRVDIANLVAAGAGEFEAVNLDAKVIPLELPSRPRRAKRLA
jgi:circadian clock protein KaiC